MPETSIAPPSAPVSRPAKPVSEALLNEKVCSFFKLHSFCFIMQLERELGKLAMGAERVDWANRVWIVGSLSLLALDPIVPRSFFRCRVLGSAFQAEGVACVGWAGFRCWEGL